MPIVKIPKIREPLWNEWDRLAQKNGIRHKIFSVNGDEYTGEWKDNKKHGTGTYKWKNSGNLYDGDWRCDKRNGFGTLSVPDGKGGLRKEYSGGWKNNKRHGYGTNFYTENEYYEGEWYGGKRSGWGRMYFADGTIYEGEWYDDKKSGQGMLRLPASSRHESRWSDEMKSGPGDGNRYEGLWQNGMKSGPGKFYYLDTGQLLEGVWVDDISKCGSITDFSRNSAPHPTIYPIPEVELCDPKGVMAEAKERFLPEQE